jgi:hypothetical protein
MSKNAESMPPPKLATFWDGTSLPDKLLQLRNRFMRGTPETEQERILTIARDVGMSVRDFLAADHGDAVLFQDTNVRKNRLVLLPHLYGAGRRTTLAGNVDNSFLAHQRVLFNDIPLESSHTYAWFGCSFSGAGPQQFIWGVKEETISQQNDDSRFLAVGALRKGARISSTDFNILTSESGAAFTIRATLKANLRVLERCMSKLVGKKFQKV